MPLNAKNLIKMLTKENLSNKIKIASFKKRIRKKQILFIINLIITKILSAKKEEDNEKYSKINSS